MLAIDLSGRRALVAGVADDAGYGFAIAKALAEAGATVCVGTWPPALNIFMNSARAREARRVPPIEQRVSCWSSSASIRSMPRSTRSPRLPRTSGRTSDTESSETFRSMVSCRALTSDFGTPSLDIVVHSLANGPEVKKPLLETSRAGYLAAVGVSAYSLVSLVSRFGPLLRPNASVLSLTYMASERVIPGYGGGMSSAKAALESDTRTLAYEAGRKWGVRVNTISAGPLASRAASAIGIIERMVQYCSANSPLTGELTPIEVGHAAAFLSSSFASGITGTTVYVDKGYHAMGMAPSLLE